MKYQMNVEEKKLWNEVIVRQPEIFFNYIGVKLAKNNKFHGGVKIYWIPNFSNLWKEYLNMSMDSQAKDWA